MKFSIIKDIASIYSKKIADKTKAASIKFNKFSKDASRKIILHLPSISDEERQNLLNQL